ncbi:MAG: hypothetical protein CMI90_00395 [Pelagibacteraceae bacterium]|nr:hypothetical protein [Pelagibacteraceae bacterium]|tara:strand:- start:10 stop:417 length:408 start_codon:yes stop_codon:yes gene_type:complete
MIESFNGIFYFTIFLIALVMGVYYAYQCLFNTKSFMEKYGVDDTAGFFARFAGSYAAGVALMQLYILFRGTEGTWAFFNFVFITFTIIAVASFYTAEIDKLGRTDKTTKEGWLATGGLAVIFGILCFGLSDKIYM